MLGENKVLIYERMFSLTETCKTQSNHQAHEIIIPQLSQCHTVAHRILRWSMRLLHLMTLVCCFSLCYQLLAKNNIDQEYNRVKISFFIIEISVGSFHLPKCDLFLPSSALQQHTLWISSFETWHVKETFECGKPSPTEWGKHKCSEKTWTTKAGTLSSCRRQLFIVWIILVVFVDVGVFALISLPGLS